ncbi:hypothetical protein [Oceanibium sediminis]|uniref:hypothetical protein n=1 Tax=Oceanibium sediminis TaxID=2026339 RepID=UPI001300AE52|nr:hypothetical protein [Oceanibium sediminis]
MAQARKPGHRFAFAAGVQDGAEAIRTGNTCRSLSKNRRARPLGRVFILAPKRANAAVLGGGIRNIHDDTPADD